MKVLIIEDEKDIRDFVKSGLEGESFIVDAVEDGKTGLERAMLYAYDVIILDLYLPGQLNGIDIAREIRKKNQAVPIIVLTVEPEVDVKVKMLEVCDDYVTKPFSLKELAARIRSVLRRGKKIRGDILKMNDLIMDVKAFRVTCAGQEIRLRNKEFALLEYFMRNPGIVLSRGTILEHVWDMNADPMTNTVDVHVRMLRKKLFSGQRKELIKTIPGRGYKIEAWHKKIYALAKAEVSVFFIFF